MEYTILIHQAEEGGFWVEVPVLPGCYSQGESFEETMKNIKEAIELNLSVLQEEKEEIPVEEIIFIGKVKVEVPIVEYADKEMI